MIKKCISADWLLSVNGGKEIKVDLPNDFAINTPRSKDARGGAGNGYFVGGIGCYTKYTTLEGGKHYILDVDGAYMCAQIEVNDHFVATHPHGYSPFLVDITDKIRPDKLNRIRITTNDMQPSSRWYSGAGIYRDVFLWTGGSVRIEPWDIFVKTVSADSEWAKLAVSYKLTSDINATVTLRSSIGTHAAKSAEVDVKAGEKTEIKLFFDIEKPQLWDVDNPQLYTMQTEIITEGALSDTSKTTFGIRTVSFDAHNGCLLNGKPIKLRGGCIHHDHGGLGAISLPAAEERKIGKLKSVGFNAIRSAHNPPSLALLETCDRLGMLVMDEAFDMWTRPKRPYDYHLWFREWCKRDISYMVMRDRNHPSVISYSIGNEIPESDGSSDCAEIALMLADEIRKYDNSRAVTGAVCRLWRYTDNSAPEEYKTYIREKFGNPDELDLWATLTDPFFAPLDIAGYNYLWERVEKERTARPNRVIWHSETHAIHFYDSWKTVTDNPNVVGDFTWTAYDNLGEAGTGRSLWARDGFIPGISLAQYPWRTCYQGDFDISGFRRPQSYFREAIWRDNCPPRIFTTHPEHYGEGFSGTEWHWYDVHETWSFDKRYIGRPVKCETYTTADRIEWYLNGEKVAESIPEKAIAYATVKYTPGTLTAVAYKGDTECSHYSLSTVGEASHIKLVPSKNKLHSDNRDIVFIEITVCDANGNTVTDGEHNLACTVSGGELLCLYSGNPCNEDDYTQKKCHSFEGHALADVRAARPADISVTVYSDTLAPASVSIEAKNHFVRRFV